MGTYNELFVFLEFPHTAAERRRSQFRPLDANAISAQSSSGFELRWRILGLSPRLTLSTTRPTLHCVPGLSRTLEKRRPRHLHPGRSQGRVREVTMKPLGRVLIAWRG